MKRDALIFLIFLWGASFWWLVGVVSPPEPAEPWGVQAVVPQGGDQQASLPGPEQFPSRELLDALSFVESSNNPRAVSSAGARGLYQFMPNTWSGVMNVPFAQAFEPVSSEIAAVRYLEWIKSTLTTWRGFAPDVIDVLACWHGGIGRYKRLEYDLARMPERTKQFVARVTARMRIHDN